MFTFGGGYAMISLIENDCVEKKKWITHDEMMDMTVIAESTPGPVAINCATYVGYKKGKLLGANCHSRNGTAFIYYLILNI
jgi:chromate transporter